MFGPELPLGLLVTPVNGHDSHSI